jgi:hypothetical protein
MNKLFTFIFVLFSAVVTAQNDTIHVQAQDDAQLTWNGNYDATAVFPSEGSFEKITMDFIMGCADGGCSHWDYTVSVYLMEPTGTLDSNIAVLDTISVDSLVVDTTWNVYEVYEKFELGRLITPYGNYMDWNQPSDPNDIFEDSWQRSYVFDVTDYAPLLKDSTLIRVHYGGWSSGFSSTINFDFIEGTPAREVLSIENIYPVGSYSYESLADNVHSPSIEKTFDSEVKSVALKSYISGHGHEGPQNCCEWISKQHRILINGEQEFNWNVWTDCGMIPLYPQGGTWPFDRAGWCPGTKVDLQVSDLTDYVVGSTAEIDYNIEPYSSNGEQAGSFIVSNTLFTYGENNFQNDVELYDIITPTKKDAWSRMNPICSTPVVQIKNNGSEPLTSVSLQYGIDDGELLTYTWEGSLNFMEIATVELPTPSWDGVTQNSKFTVTALLEGDEYGNNNTLTSDIKIPDVIPSTFVLAFRTQASYQGTNRAQQSSYTVYNDQGDVMYERFGEELEPSTWYKDTMYLEIGCYELVFRDAAEDGVNEHWYYGEGSSYAGKIEIRNLSGQPVKKFPDDFGQQIDYKFTVDFPLEIEPVEGSNFEVFPNPVKDYITMSLSLGNSENVNFVLYNSLGEELERISRSQFTVGTERFDMRTYKPGTYFCKAYTESEELVQKVVLVE